MGGRQKKMGRRAHFLLPAARRRAFAKRFRQALSPSAFAKLSPDFFARPSRAGADPEIISLGNRTL
jgi:hypothetical protein